MSPSKKEGRNKQSRGRCGDAGFIKTERTRLAIGARPYEINRMYVKCNNRCEGMLAHGISHFEVRMLQTPNVGGVDPLNASCR